MTRWKSSVSLEDVPNRHADSSQVLRVTRAEPIVGWRVWRVREVRGQYQLIGLHRETCWIPGRVETAFCRARHGVPFPRYCHCGLWAFLSVSDVHDFLRRAQSFNDRPSRLDVDAVNEGVASLIRSMKGPHLVGGVALWGTIRISAGGLGQVARAQFARVTNIAPFPGTDDELVSELSRVYGVPSTSGSGLRRRRLMQNRQAS